MISYLVALCGLAALFISGAIGLALFAVFLLTALLAWKLEGTRWQISERLGVVIILIAIPLFVIDWKFRLSGLGAREILAASSLAKLILFLSALKLLQRKSDRDWVFIYLIAFFQILLAAGVSISPLYLVSLLAYLLLTTSAIIAFEIRKTSGEVQSKRDRNLGRSAGTPLVQNLAISRTKLPLAAVLLMAATTIVALPLFFTLPRVGGAGLTGSLSDTTRLTGFSDSVTLGAIGRLQQNDETVMRVRIDRNDNQDLRRFLWRGVALDRFENKTWSRSSQKYQEPYTKTEGGRFVVDYARRDGALTVQTVYLEALNTNVLFGLSRPIVVKSGASEVSKDSEGGLYSYPPTFERTSYTIFSDTYIPPPEDLRNDIQPYPRSAYKYLAVPPELDRRIGELAADVINRENVHNRYDIAKAIERHLQNDYGYTLQMKAGGPDPLADFLFRVREGHCEYFATAMAIMLRSQGIATRVVNGFQQGDYNETAEVYVVKQKNAHSWVEVYFPGERIWVPFDPTPFAGQYSDAASGTLMGRLGKYLEAVETFWIQYFVTYDDQEQRSLFRSFRESVVEYRNTGASWLHALQVRLTEWWQRVRGDAGLYQSAKALGVAIGATIGAILLAFGLFRLFRKIAALPVWARIGRWMRRKNEAAVVGFYARMQDILEGRGFTRAPHQTPLEFAYASGLNEAVLITEKYNRVRFGGKKLSEDESDAIEDWLKRLEAIKGQ